jgi:hypothetical protein
MFLEIFQNCEDNPAKITKSKTLANYKLQSLGSSTGNLMVKRDATLTKVQGTNDACSKPQ